MKTHIKIPTRVGLELLIPINTLFLYAFYNVLTTRNWHEAFILFPVAILVNYIFFSIKYKIEDAKLMIKTGFFGTQKIDISNITKIEKTYSPLSSPAPSITGRIEIYYSKFDSIIISPKNYNLLKTELLKINPKIQFKD